MTRFINDDFMLHCDAAKELYHKSAASLPIIDYHCHLDPSQILSNYQFRNLSEIWLGGDHYKWRAMRGNGVGEEYITGAKSDYEKFEKWADTLQRAMRNPLYHWTHLELSRIFGVDEVLNPLSARKIYDECSEKLQTEQFRAQAIMRSCNVESICTTDDPIDSLECHKQIQANPFGVKVLPTWRPDKALAIATVGYNDYIDSLAAAASITINSYEDLLAALQTRHDYFAQVGCKLADHGLSNFLAAPYTEAQASKIFSKVRSGGSISDDEQLIFQSALIVELCRMNHVKGWAQQIHIGAVRNNNTRMFNSLGADTGFDAINDMQTAENGHRMLDRLAVDDRLAKTVLYNLNPKDNEVFATMAYTFNEAPTPGKVQYGAAWWFLDQEDGMRKQINSLSSLGLLSRFVGMLTDSRSFLSYPRHEYFRRILCQMLGEELENGKLPQCEIEFIHQMVKDICYNNAKNYFNF